MKPAQLGLPTSSTAKPQSGQDTDQKQSYRDGADSADVGSEKSKVEKDKAHRGAEEAGNTGKSALRKAYERDGKNIQELTPNSPKRQAVISDHELLMKVREKLKREELISEQVAKQAKDEEIRKNLLIVARAQKEKEEYRREENRLATQMAELGKLAAAAAASAVSMGEMKTPNGAKAPGQLISGKSKDSGIESGVGVKSTEADVKGAPTKEQIAANEKEKAAMLKELQSGGASGASKIKDLSLRNKVLAELKAAQAAEGKMGSIGNSGLNQTDPAKRDNAAAKVVAEVLTPPAEADNSFAAGGGGRTGNGFSLSTSETNAEVKRLTEEAERQLSATEAAADIKAGILETDSVSLFERVKSKLSGCLKQRCVASSSTVQK